ncbi:hypothetical protein [Campylobacter sp. 7477a]|uniref:hypothetical protein n=1 Tax=Campylobacter sp. 7477a TaxID=2735741 RepID=UPI003014480A|nr:hypothetical protein [Campylobacter sp. 7477a]
MKNALIASLFGLAATQNDFGGFGGNQAKDSRYSGVWYQFKGLKDKSKLLPRFVRRARLRAYVKGA